MAGAQSVASAVPRLVLALTCVVLVSMAAAPAAIANTPAGDQYGQFLPGAGNGGGAGSNGGGGSDTSTPSTSSGGVTTVPVAPRSQGTADTSSTGDGSSQASNQGAGSKHKSSTDKSSKGNSSAPTEPRTTVADNSAQSAPQIASNTGSDGWVPFFIAALVALAAAAAAVIYVGRRRTAHD